MTNTSLVNDGYSNTIVFVRQCSTYVICSDRGGTKEEFFFYSNLTMNLHVHFPLVNVIVDVLWLLNVAATQLHPNNWRNPQKYKSWSRLMMTPAELETMSILDNLPHRLHTCNFLQVYMFKDRLGAFDGMTNSFLSISLILFLTFFYAYVMAATDLRVGECFFKDILACHGVTDTVGVGTSRTGGASEACPFVAVVAIPSVMVEDVSHIQLC
ncbi:uncharacterized protein LOC114177346 [Vigna unguiculata]|uniref:uncharacterized protein LOC114177346 n=1 Tax=Vigna unguiculata TaxID=3917 RepID=UPI001016D0F8|nr:uncharacterized protein LOC114177346 [Vigna unguiculata]